jgi:hypothetical protein
MMSEELIKAQQHSEDADDLSDDDLEDVSGGADATAISNSKADDGSIAISDATANATDIKVNQLLNKNYNQYS